MSGQNKENQFIDHELCKCFESNNLHEENENFNSMTRVENYFRERRINELIQFLLTKLLVDAPNKPILYMEKLLNECMLFRAGHGIPPVLYGDSHLEAIMKSFDPGQRGWLSEGQTRRVFITLGLKPPINLDEQIPCNVVFESLKKAQENELFELLSAGYKY
ncbi:hypothetical protein ACJJTC_007958 [Scirpophaga incertulas]